MFNAYKNNESVSAPFYVCRICFHSFPTQAQRNNHAPKHKSSFTCQLRHDGQLICLKSFPMHHLLSRHQDEMRNEAKYCRCGVSTIYNNCFTGHTSRCNKAVPSNGKFWFCPYFSYCLLIAEFSEAFETFLEDDGRSARAQIQMFDEQLNKLLPASSQHQSNIFSPICIMMTTSAQQRRSSLRVRFDTLKFVSAAEPLCTCSVLRTR